MSTDTGFQSRPLDRSQLPQWARLFADIQAADGDENILGAEDLAEEFDEPDTDFDRGSIAFYDADVMVGYCVLYPRTAADPVHMMRMWGGVHPRYRGLGIGTRLLDWAEAAAAPLHAARFAARPLTLAAACLAKVTDAVALLEASGYQQARWFHDMDCDLAAWVPRNEVPDGIQIVGYSPERSSDALMIRNESFRDHWDSTDTTAESWRHFMSLRAFRPGFSFLAYDGTEPVGVIISHEYDAYTELTGKRGSYIAIVGTRRAARKRGVATALLTAAMSAAKDDGCVMASLGVDADSPTGAVSIYQRMGFAIRDTTLLLVKPLS